MTSKIKVDNIENQCGGAVVTKCGATTTISGSVVKANDIQAADGGNLINQCGTTITLGASGDTINLASGASQTGFGRTGTVDWDTTAKTASFTAVSGNGYFVNTTSGAVTVTLPAGSAGNIVSLADYAATWQTNSVTVTPNGTDKIGGVNTSVGLNTEGQSVTFIYSDSTQGWLNTMDSTSNVRGSPFIAATGGTITTCGDYKIHTFTGPGTFTVTAAGAPTGSTTVDYLVIAGGAGGGGHVGSGGGAGGARMSSGTASGCYTASPLGTGVAAIPVSVTAYPITVGGGGAGSPDSGVSPNPGSNSVFSTITSTGGAGGGTPTFASKDGGSGGGGSSTTNATGGLGNTPPVSPPQGNNGGTGLQGPPTNQSGGGGGAGAVGGNASMSQGGAGGAGIQNNICGSNYYWSGGGGGSSGYNPGHSAVGGAGGIGGGGGASVQGSGPGGAGGGSAINSGGSGTASAGATGGAGGANSGGGGGGGAHPSGFGGAGGSGIVIIRYKFQ
jgi:hypothetical protein